MIVLIPFVDNKSIIALGEGMEESPRESLRRTLTGHGPMGVLRYVQYGFTLSSSLVFLTVSYELRSERSPRVVLYSETAGLDLLFR